VEKEKYKREDINDERSKNKEKGKIKKQIKKNHGTGKYIQII
jgi:hypothetical protein